MRMSKSCKMQGTAYTTRIATNGKVATGVSIARVLECVLEPGDVVALGDEGVHGLDCGLCCPSSTHIAFEAARIVVQGRPWAHVDGHAVVKRYQHHLISSQDMLLVLLFEGTRCHTATIG